MKVLVDIKDEKVPFFMEVLKNFKFVKAAPFVEEKTQLEDEIKEAVENLKLSPLQIPLFFDLVFSGQIETGC